MADQQVTIDVELLKRIQKHLVSGPGDPDSEGYADNCDDYLAVVAAVDSILWPRTEPARFWVENLDGTGGRWTTVRDL